MNTVRPPTAIIDGIEVRPQLVADVRCEKCGCTVNCPCIGVHEFHGIGYCWWSSDPYTCSSCAYRTDYPVLIGCPETVDILLTTCAAVAASR